MSIRYRLFGILLAGAAYAQQAGAPEDQPDPEDASHGVARISLINGDVAVRRGDSGDSVAANVNAPMLAGDAIQTGQASRAELEFDNSTRIRLSDFADVRLGDLSTGKVQVQVGRGVTTFSIVRDLRSQVEISTPSASIHPLQPGDYRVEVTGDGNAATVRITVRGGEAEVYTPRGSQRVANGWTMLVRGPAADPEYQVVAAQGVDDWDRFNDRRNRELQQSAAYRHVSPDITGAEDLDAYGHWVDDREYGQVWAPNVAADWAPYQSGRWSWGGYYGWTWVSYDPWGWAPYHYGRWFRGSAGWCWYPGSLHGRYGYRPALVSFFGFGGRGYGGAGGFGFGNVGWVALAPHESFHRWWGRGYEGRGLSGVGGNVNVYNTYRNARVFNGVSSVTAQQFSGAQFGRVSHPTAGQITSAGAFQGRLPIGPGAANYRFNDRQPAAPARAARAPQTFVSRGQNLTARQPAQQPNSTWGRFGATGNGGNNFRPQSSYEGRAVQISPPIVQQRSTPQTYRQPAPQYRQSSPSQNPAPSYRQPQQQSSFGRPSAPSPSSNRPAASASRPAPQGRQSSPPSNARSGGRNR